MLTVKDVIEKTPEEIIQHMQTTKEEVSETKKTRDSYIIDHIRRLLKGFFKDDQTSLSKGSAFEVEDWIVEVVSYIPSTDRYFFKIGDDKFSLQRKDLLGLEFPYKVGDCVEYQNLPCIIEKIKPATNKLVVDLGGNKLDVKVSEVNARVNN